MKKNVLIVIVALVTANLGCSKKVCSCGALGYEDVLRSELSSATWQLVSSYQYEANTATLTKTLGTVADTAYFGYAVTGLPVGTYKNFTFFSGGVKAEYTIGIKDSLILLTTPCKGIYSDTMRVLTLDMKYITLKVKKANDPYGSYELDSMKKVRLYY